ncbi:Uncharacterised protein [Yersinia mollaretii]|nr:Uncharacterised protein [Yersinia mollaretii]
MGNATHQKPDHLTLIRLMQIKNNSYWLLS